VGTKDPNLERIHALSPDLILAVKEENRLEDIASLSEDYPCLVFDIYTVAQATTMVQQLAGLLGGSEEVSTAFIQTQEWPLTSKRLSVLYLIWQDPHMTIGADTYIADVLRHAGFVLPNPALMRYPEVNIPAFCAKHRGRPQVWWWTLFRDRGGRRLVRNLAL
jgi:ABC-type Fe3+-hydroxamate transport system substrate-binding protein